jgi:lysyl-tRNA synthetase class 1
LTTSENQIIGKGTWIDKIADSLVNRESKLGRSLQFIRVESGLGASGVPHIGSMGDAVRSYGISRALNNFGYNSELITYSDDMDGLRKIPHGFPKWLTEYLAKPVSSIPDPYGGCHKSYGAHMSSLLLDGLDAVGVKYRFQSATEAYKEGTFVQQIDAILRNSDILGRKIVQLVGQDKYTDTLPYFPICRACGRLYVAKAEKYLLDEKKVSYRCIGSTIGNNVLQGCGHMGESDITKGDGKLAWKVEFAARWKALDIRFEAFGKDIMDSVRVNDWVSNEILGYIHPFHVKYELFLDKGGRKISKSGGNVLTPQMWLRYGTAQSILLLLFKRITGTRMIGLDEIPQLMDEYDLYEDLYFDKIKEENKVKLAKIKGIYEYINHLIPPHQPDIHVPYNFLIQQAALFPANERTEKVYERLLKYNIVKDRTLNLTKRIRLVSNWVDDILPSSEQKYNIELSDREKKAIADLVHILQSFIGLEDQHDTPRMLQSKIFDIARSNGIEPKAFFTLIYRILLNTDKGPRIGNYAIDLGIERTCKIIKSHLNPL